MTIRQIPPLGSMTMVGLGMLLLLVPTAAHGQRAGRGGAPAAGSGAVDLTGFVRVIDGDTIETRINGKRVGIGLLGIDAPTGNTACGREAAAQLRTLVRGGLRLEEDRSLTFDECRRRLYRVVTRTGRPADEVLTEAGVARADGRGTHRQSLAAAEAASRAARRGCLWGRGVAGSIPDGRLATMSPDLGFQIGGGAGALETSSRDSNPVSAAGPPSAVAPLANVPGGFAEDVVASGLTDPTAFAFLPDGRILISEKRGLVRVQSGGQVLPAPMIDISDRVNDYWDHGLLGIVADPGFASNGFIYVLYTYENEAGWYDGPKTARQARYTVHGDAASPDSEKVIVGRNVGYSCQDFPAGADCLPSENPSLSVGAVKFAADGSLFLTVGDAASFNVVDGLAMRAQELDSLAGKVLRVNADGAGMADNPFWTGDAWANRSKAWARGLRNPYRFNVRPGSGVPYIGDVGWDAWEEVNVATAGANLGWPCYEGPERQAGYEPNESCQTLFAQGPPAVHWPLVALNHGGEGAAVTGVAFYTGTTYRSQYQGAYFYADYTRGRIRWVRVDADHGLVGAPADFATGAGGPVAIEMGPDQNLYYLAISSGQLVRIRSTTAPPPPPPPPGTGGYVSDRAWASVTNGWGPVEKDHSNGDLAAGDGGVLTIQGVTYAKGLGVHAASDVRYALGGACTQFTAQVGVDDEVGGNGSVVFQVWADGTKLYDSGLVTGTAAARAVSVNVAGKQQLQLVVTDGGDGGDYDHAD
jgi:glucose/arabinose dehydrogenase/endonuclease YncB( thermonuclease family)